MSILHRYISGHVGQKSSLSISFSDVSPPSTTSTDGYPRPVHQTSSATIEHRVLSPTREIPRLLSSSREPSAEASIQHRVLSPSRAPASLSRDQSEERLKVSLQFWVIYLFVSCCVHDALIAISIQLIF